MKKIILFLLIVTFIAEAQRPRRADEQRSARSPYAQSILWRDLHKSTQDSIRQAVADSLAALSTDGVTIANSAGTFQQKVFTDTASAAASSGISAGMQIIIKQLSVSNTKGGGTFIKIPKGYSTSLIPGISFTNADGDTLLREIVYQGAAIKPEWFGAAIDGVTDDVAALDAAESAARILDRDLELPGGTIRIATKWQIANISQDEGIRVTGQGPAKTVLLLGSGAKIEVGNGGSPRSRNVVLENFLVRSEAVKQDTAIFFNNVGNCKIFNIRVGENGGNNFFWSLIGYRTEHTVLENFDALYNFNGVKFLTNANGNMLLSCNIGQMDSICVQFDNGSHGNQVIGGEFGNSPLGILATDISEVHIQSVNIETVDSAAVVVGNESEITLSNFNLSNGVGADGWFAIVGTGRLTINSFSVPQYQKGNRYIKETGTARVIFNGAKRERLNGGAYYGTTNYPTSPEFTRPILPYLTYAENSGALSSTNYDENRGLLWGKFTRTGIAGDDKYYFIGKTDSGYVPQNLGLGGRIYTSTTGSGGSEPTAFIEYEGYKDFTSSAGDSSEVTITTDSNGVNSFYTIHPAAIYKVGGGVFDAYATIKEFNASAGTVTFVVWHKSDTGGSISLRLYYKIAVRD